MTELFHNHFILVQFYQYGILKSQHIIISWPNFGGIDFLLYPSNLNYFLFKPFDLSRPKSRVLVFKVGINKIANCKHPGPFVLQVVKLLIVPSTYFGKVFGICHNRSQLNNVFVKSQWNWKLIQFLFKHSILYKVLWCCQYSQVCTCFHVTLIFIKIVIFNSSPIWPLLFISLFPWLIIPFFSAQL